MTTIEELAKEFFEKFTISLMDDNTFIHTDFKDIGPIELWQWFEEKLKEEISKAEEETQNAMLRLPLMHFQHLRASRGLLQN